MPSVSTTTATCSNSTWVASRTSMRAFLPCAERTATAEQNAQKLKIAGCGGLCSVIDATDLANIGEPAAR